MVDATVDEESKLESFDSLQFPSLGLIFHIRRSLSFDLQWRQSFSFQQCVTM